MQSVGVEEKCPLLEQKNLLSGTESILLKPECPRRPSLTIDLNKEEKIHESDEYNAVVSRKHSDYDDNLGQPTVHDVKNGNVDGKGDTGVVRNEKRAFSIVPVNDVQISPHSNTDKVKFDKWTPISDSSHPKVNKRLSCSLSELLEQQSVLDANEPQKSKKSLDSKQSSKASESNEILDHALKKSANSHDGNKNNADIRQYRLNLDIPRFKGNVDIKHDEDNVTFNKCNTNGNSTKYSSSGINNHKHHLDVPNEDCDNSLNLVKCSNDTNIPADTSNKSDTKKISFSNYPNVHNRKISDAATHFPRVALQHQMSLNPSYMTINNDNSSFFNDTTSQYFTIQPAR